MSATSEVGSTVRTWARTHGRRAARISALLAPATLLALAALAPLAGLAHAEQTGTQPAPIRGRADARCPPTVVVEERVPEPPEGWSVQQHASGHRLAGVTFYDGPPAGEASLVYDETATKGDDWIATWRFATNPGGYSVVCRYEGTTMELTRALPPAVTVCRVAYDKRIVTDPRHDEVRRIECE